MVTPSHDETERAVLLAEMDQEYSNKRRLVEKVVADVIGHLDEKCCDPMLVWFRAVKKLVDLADGANSSREMLCELLGIAVFQLAEERRAARPTE